MTPVALFNDLVRFTWFLLSGVLIWSAVFLIITGLLRYEPVHLKLLSKSRRERIGLILLFAPFGVAAIMDLPNPLVADPVRPDMVIAGCMCVGAVLVCPIYVWLSTIDLGRAVCLRQQQPHQQADEQRRVISDQ
jgi:hypothetical protein